MVRTDFSSILYTAPELIDKPILDEIAKRPSLDFLRIATHLWLRLLKTPSLDSGSQRLARFSASRIKGLIFNMICDIQDRGSI
jgi:hypothetical protein